MPTGTTTNFALPLFGDTDMIAPVQNLFNAISNGVEAALNKVESVFVNQAALPTAGNRLGRTGYVQSDSTFRMWDGSTWQVLYLDTGWVPLTGFQSGFSARPGVEPAYRRINNVAYLTGQLYISTAPTAGAVAFTLPATIRPKNTLMQTTVFSWGAFCTLSIDGNFQYQGTIARTSGLGYPLDGISFPIG